MSPLPTLTSHQMLIFLLEVLLLLATATALGALATRLRLPAVAGELLAGALLGPSLLGHLLPAFNTWLFPPNATQSHLLDVVGQFGAILLVGVIGADLDVRMLRPIVGTVGRISALSLVIPFGLGFAGGFLIPATLVPQHTDRLVFALLLAVALSVSAIPVIAKTLSDMRLMHRDISQVILAAATVDDAVAWFGLSVVSALAASGLSAARFGTTALYLFGFLAVAITLGPRLVRLAAALASRFSEPTSALTAIAFLVIIVGGASTDALRFEAVFGAFVAGTLLSAADVSRVVLERLRTVVMAVFAPLFLATAGLRMDVISLAHPVAIVTTLAVLATAVVSKFGGAFAGGRLSGLGVPESIALGAGLNSRGVVQIVIALTGLQLRLISLPIYTILLVVAIGTSIMTAPLLRIAVRDIPEQEHEERRQVRLSPEEYPALATI